nr:MAG TPA: hypothetical protein [Caudoviricetes sp.]DAS68771.1 MAG TPA: hypothetical protein [Caudoviricetes sp.]DAX60598.1 MAG TPA: hypothetical protein [Caudoviricetes sp.]
MMVFEFKLSFRRLKKGWSILLRIKASLKEVLTTFLQ